MAAIWPCMLPASDEPSQSLPVLISNILIFCTHLFRFIHKLQIMRSIQFYFFFPLMCSFAQDDRLPLYGADTIGQGPRKTVYVDTGWLGQKRFPDFTNNRKNYEIANLGDTANVKGPLWPTVYDNNGRQRAQIPGMTWSRSQKLVTKCLDDE